MSNNSTNSFKITVLFDFVTLCQVIQILAVTNIGGKVSILSILSIVCTSVTLSVGIVLRCSTHLMHHVVHMADKKEAAANDGGEDLESTRQQRSSYDVSVVSKESVGSVELPGVKAQNGRHEGRTSASADSFVVQQVPRGSVHAHRFFGVEKSNATRDSHTDEENGSSSTAADIGPESDSGASSENSSSDSE